MSGVQQGNPLGPLLFFLVLHEFMEATQNEVTTDDPYVETFFIDDGMIFGTYAHLASQLRRFSSDTTKEYGFFLKHGKCQLWWPTKPPKLPDTVSQFVKWDENDGIELLGCHLGPPAYHQRAFDTKREEMHKGLRQLPLLRDAHVAVELLRECLSVCKVQQIMRTSPPDWTKNQVVAIGNMLRRSFAEITSANPSDELWRELKLPISSKSFGKREDQEQGSQALGIGIHSAKNWAASACIASIIDSENVVSALLERFEGI